MMKGFPHDLNGCADSSGNEGNSLRLVRVSNRNTGAALTLHRISKRNLLMAAQALVPWDDE